MNPPAAPRPAPPTRPHHRPLNNLPGFGAPHRLQAGAVPATVLVSITSPWTSSGPAQTGSGLRNASSARRNPPQLAPCELSATKSACTRSARAHLAQCEPR